MMSQQRDTNVNMQIFHVIIQNMRYPHAQCFNFAHGIRETGQFPG